MQKSIKTTISRKKIYERNYIRDNIEEIKYDQEINSGVKYDSLAKVLAAMYFDISKEEV